MAIDANAVHALTGPAIEAPNAGASFADILKGLISTAGQAYIAKEVAPRQQPDYYYDTAIGEQYANRVLQTGQFFSSPTGAITIAVAALAVGFLIFKAVD